MNHPPFSYNSTPVIIPPWLLSHFMSQESWWPHPYHTQRQSFETNTFRKKKKKEMRDSILLSKQVSPTIPRKAPPIVLQRSSIVIVRARHLNYAKFITRWKCLSYPNRSMFRTMFDVKGNCEQTKLCFAKYARSVLQPHDTETSDKYIALYNLQIRWQLYFQTSQVEHGSLKARTYFCVFFVPLRKKSLFI